MLVSVRNCFIALCTLESGILELIWRSVVFGTLDFGNSARRRVLCHNRLYEMQQNALSAAFTPILMYIIQSPAAAVSASTANVLINQQKNDSIVLNSTMCRGSGHVLFRIFAAE